MAKDDAQLDLLGVLSAPASAAPTARADIRWAKRDLAGRLGWSSSTVSVAELRAAKATIAVAIGADPEPWRGAKDIDVRHLALPLDEALVERHLAALTVDARAGRRAVVAAEDEQLAAWLVGAALVDLGANAAESVVALGGRSALGPQNVAKLEARASARGRARETGEDPLFAATAKAAPDPGPQS